MTQFTIGAEASCTDGVCGEMTRVVIDPIAETVTHLVIEPKHRVGLARLVPLDLVDDTAGEVRLRCTIEEFEQLDPAEETQFVPGSSGYAAYGADQVVSWPYYSLAPAPGIDPEVVNTSPVVTYDTIPLGEVEVRRGDAVHATDGDIGRVQGLVIDPRSHHVTHVLLQEGHLWGRKEVSIPISSVTRVDEEALHLPDLTIDGVDPGPRPHLLLTDRNNVLEDRGLPQRCSGHALAPDYLGGFCTRDQVAFRGVVELVELRARAAQPDFPVRGLDQGHGDKPPGLLPVPRLDDKVSDRLSGRVDDQAAHLAAVTIRAACPGPDRELRLSGHGRLLSSCWTLARACGGGGYEIRTREALPEHAFQVCGVRSR